jgi:hypothetical protein
MVPPFSTLPPFSERTKHRKATRYTPCVGLTPTNTQKTNSGTGGRIFFQFSGIPKNNPERSKKVVKIFSLDLKWPNVTPDDLLKPNCNF